MERSFGQNSKLMVYRQGLTGVQGNFCGETRVMLDGLSVSESDSTIFLCIPGCFLRMRIGHCVVDRGSMGLLVVGRVTY